jgi:glycosyltransferase involved in cell wall biosynthesis
VHLRFARAFPGEVGRIRRLIRERRIDLVAIGGLVNVHAALAARLEDVPIVWHVLDTRAPAALRKLLMPIVTRLADTLMFTGKAVMDLHVDPRRLRVPAVVYASPVDTRQFRPSAERRAATRAELGIAASTTLVGTVANLNPQKGLEYFIRAAAHIHRLHPDSAFVVVGSRYDTHRSYAALLEQEARRSGIPAERLLFVDHRPDIERYYPAFDVKLITSVPRSEGVPTTTLEAMACGVPVVTTDVGAVAEAVVDGATGFVVPPQDADAIAAAALRLIDDVELRARLGHQARQRAVQHYDVEVSANATARAHDTALAHHAARRPSAAPTPEVLRARFQRRADAPGP